MELVLVIKKIRLMGDFMAKKEDIVDEYFQGKRSFVNTVDDYCDLLKEEI